MTKKTSYQVKISQRGLLRVAEVLAREEALGYSANWAAAMALTAVGLPLRPTIFIVDPNLIGEVFPFMGPS